jgi:hypothetical protein
LKCQKCQKENQPQKIELDIAPVGSCESDKKCKNSVIDGRNDLTRRGELPQLRVPQPKGVDQSKTEMGKPHDRQYNVIISGFLDKHHGA